MKLFKTASFDAVQISTVWEETKGLRDCSRLEPKIFRDQAVHGRLHCRASKHTRWILQISAGEAHRLLVGKLFELENHFLSQSHVKGKKLKTCDGSSEEYAVVIEKNFFSEFFLIKLPL